MSFHYKVSFGLLLFFILFFSVDAAHGRPPLHRRSLSFGRRGHHRRDLTGILGDVNNLAGGLVGPGGTSITPPSNASPSTIPTPDTPPSMTSSPATTTPAPSDPPPSTSDPPSTSSPASSPPSSNPAPSTSPPPTSSPQSSPPLSSSSTPASSSADCPQGFDLLGNCLSHLASSLPTTTSPIASTTSAPPTSAPSSSPQTSGALPTTSSSPPSTSPSSQLPSPTCLLGLGADGNCLIPALLSQSPPPASSPSTTSQPQSTTSNSPPADLSSASTPAPSSTTPVDPCGPVGRLLGLCSDTPQSLTSASSSTPSSGAILSATSAPTQPASTSSQSTDPCGPLGIALGQCQSTSSVPSSSIEGFQLQSASTSPSSASSTAPPDPCGPLGVALGSCSSAASPVMPSSSLPNPVLSNTPSLLIASDSSASAPAPSTFAMPSSSLLNPVLSNTPPLFIAPDSSASAPAPSTFAMPSTSLPNPVLSNTPPLFIAPDSSASAPAPSTFAMPSTSLPDPVSFSLPGPVSSSLPDPVSFSLPDPVSSSPPSLPIAPSSSASAPALSTFAPTEPCGPVGVALGLCHSAASPVVPSTSPPDFVPSSLPPLPAPSSSAPVPAPSTTAPTKPCGPLEIALGSCSSPSRPDAPSSTTPGPLPNTRLPATDSDYQGGTSSIPGSQSQPPSGSVSSPPSVFTPGSSSGSPPILSSPPVISFPSGTPGSVSGTAGLPSLSVASSPPSFMPPPQTQFSYVTQTSLLAVSVSSSSVPLALNDPDAAPTTLSLIAPSNSLAGPASEAPLPSNLPARIYPPTTIDPDSLSGFSLVSILFDSSLPWLFVSQNTQSQGQLFLWLPSIIQAALGLPSTDVKTFALQAFVPASYHSIQDVGQLLTLYLLYIPTEQVPTLANQIKAQQSSFYLLAEPFKSLAAHVDAAFAITSVQDPNAIPGTSKALTSHGNKSRTDAIIGIVSALGGLTVIILGVLVFRSVKRNRELRHRRLSDPSMPNDPYPDRTGRDFDQDSIGGQRRRSFYFAEDSLRGQQQPAMPAAQVQTQYPLQPGSQTEYSYRTSPETMRERRVPVVPGAISAPILTQSSLNW